MASAVRCRVPSAGWARAAKGKAKSRRWRRRREGRMVRQGEGEGSMGRRQRRPARRRSTRRPFSEEEPAGRTAALQKKRGEQMDLTKQ